MTWVWWVLGAVALLVLLDRLALGAEARGWLYWRRRKPDADGGGAVLGDVFEIFQPSRQHVVEERDRKRRDIAQKESADPPFGIDLDAGTAVLRPDGAAAGTDSAAPGMETPIRPSDTPM